MKVNTVPDPVTHPGFVMIYFTILIFGWPDIRGDQGQNRRTDQPGRKLYPDGDKQAISL